MTITIPAKRARDNHKLLGTILVSISGLLYGLIGYFGMQLFYQGYSVPNMLFWRFAVATMWMLLIGFLTKRKRAPFLDKLPLMLQLAAVGAVSYSGGSAFFYLSSLYIGTGAAMVIFFSFPVFVTLFSLIFKQSKMNRYVFIALAMVITGLLLLNGNGEHDLSNTGIFLAIIAAFSYGVYVYYSQHSSSRVDSHWLTLLICLGCSFIFFGFALANHSFVIPATQLAWKDILILGVISTAIPIQLLLNGLKYISSVKASILSVFEPVTTVVIGVVFLNEHLSAMQFLGILIILCGAMVIQFEKSPKFKIETPFK
jgi:drug/metabolite transporter (DMT)-like permease